MDFKEFEKSKVDRFDACISYAENSIVSKTILKKESGNITLFAFDIHQELSEHTAPFNALVQIIDGTAGIIIDKKEYTLSTGDFIIMPANIPHAVKAPEKFKMLLTMIKS